MSRSLFVISLLGLTACVSKPQLRAAILSTQWTTAAVPGVEAERVVHRTLNSRGMSNVKTANPSVDRPGCYDDLACLRDLGSRLLVDKLVVIKLAALGETVVARLAIVDVARGQQEGTLQEVVHAADTRRVEQAVARLSTDLTQRWAPRRTKWFERWWVWAAGGVALAGAATLLIVLPNGSGPDIIIMPPLR